MGHESSYDTLWNNNPPLYHHKETAKLLALWKEIWYSTRHSKASNEKYSIHGPCSPWPPKQIPLFFVQAHNRTVKRESKTPVLGPLEFHSLEKSLRLETTHYSADYRARWTKFTKKSNITHALKLAVAISTPWPFYKSIKNGAVAIATVWRGYSDESRGFLKKNCKNA